MFDSSWCSSDGCKTFSVFFLSMVLVLKLSVCVYGVERECVYGGWVEIDFHCVALTYNFLPQPPNCDYKHKPPDLKRPALFQAGCVLFLKL